MAVELVVLIPVLIMFVMLFVACGRYVAVQGDMQATARDAVRAASLQRDSAAPMPRPVRSSPSRWTATPRAPGSRSAASRPAAPPASS